MAKVVIFGTGEGADIAFRYITADSPHDICGFTVDKDRLTVTEFHGLAVVDFENVESVFPTAEYKMFVPLGFQGMNKLRYKKYSEAQDKGYQFISYISSSIPRIEEFDIGDNCLILENQSINLDASIGNNVVMWSGNHVGNHAAIRDHTWLSSHVSINSHVTIESFCFLGSNSTISNNITIARNSFIGANVLITQDTVENGVYLAQGAKKSPFESEKFMSAFKIA